MRPWWRSAVVYQVYIRSFADGNGDGVGDIAGLRSRLRYIADLGVDAIWVNPWYPSPMKDAGYDVSDFRDIDSEFGTLAEAEAMIAEAHELGLRVLLDLVPNHLSDQHAWFQEALGAGPGSRERARFIFRDGRGLDGEEPPNDWTSGFGGPAWTRVTERDGRAGQWYLHLFAPEQPDLDWTNPEVRDEFDDTIQFWFELGVDGFRIDVAHGLAKADGLPDIGSLLWPPTSAEPVDHPHWDRDEVHEIYRRWRTLADSYDEPRVFVAEAWVHNPGRLARYVRHDELHTAFNFDFLARPWDAAALRASIDETLAAHAPADAPATWLLSNHDVTRPVTRYGRADSSFAFLAKRRGTPTDASLGRHRARAAALLVAALPGSLYIYQGDELGLDEVEDLPDERLRDPMHFRSGGVDPGRDGCRVPLPWSGDVAPFGFSPAGATTEPWLPQPSRWAELTVEAQDRDPGSMLNLYRAALRIRKSTPDLRDERFVWLDSASGVLAFRRGDAFIAMTNLGPDPVEPPPDTELLLASHDLVDGRLPPDATGWWRQRRLTGGDV